MRIIETMKYVMGVTYYDTTSGRTVNENPGSATAKPIYRIVRPQPRKPKVENNTSENETTRNRLPGIGMEIPGGSSGSGGGNGSIGGVKYYAPVGSPGSGGGSGVTIEESAKKNYLIVLASGVASKRSDNFFKYIKNEIDYNLREDISNGRCTITYLELFPYGEKRSTGASIVVSQSEDVLSDAAYETKKGASDINWRISQLEEKEGISKDATIIMIGHSGGGVAVIGAYYYMSDTYKKRVSQIVAIGSPMMPVYTGADKTTIFKDPNDAVTWTGDTKGYSAYHQEPVNNGVYKPKLTNDTAKNAALVAKYQYDVHTGYFNTAQKAANIINKFWGRAFI